MASTTPQVCDFCGKEADPEGEVRCVLGVGEQVVQQRQSTSSLTQPRPAYRSAGLLGGCVCCFAPRRFVP